MNETRSLPVYCWTCGDTLAKRNPKGPLFAPCDNCGSTNVHVIPSIFLSTVVRSQFHGMVLRGRELIRERLRLQHVAETHIAQ